MKSTVEVEKRTCDFCKKKEAYSFGACLWCGKDCCWECQKIEGMDYHAGVSFSGSGDGFYCSPCDELLTVKGDKMHAAYLAIFNLREEQENWYASFNARRKLAEAKLEEIQKRKSA